MVVAQDDCTDYPQHPYLFMCAVSSGRDTAKSSLLGKVLRFFRSGDVWRILRNDAGDLNPQLLPRRSTTRAAGNNRKSGVLSWHGVAQ